MINKSPCLKTIEVDSPCQLAQASVISSVVLMKGNGKVSYPPWNNSPK